uniref:Endonuclease/exonuclease/phosphatase domain-containing protein n=1 Tax=Cacopsylla melanoneura TaxID=428564 RepID=A0A8D8M2K6_9HEMI
MTMANSINPQVFPFADCSHLSSSFSSEPADVTGTSTPSTGTILRGLVTTCPGKLSIMHFNARSICPPDKFTDLESVVSGTGLDIVCVNESWLKPGISNAEISIPGYRVSRSDRVGRRGGGVAVYLNETFSFQVLASSPPQSDTVQYIILEVVVRSSKVLLAAVYDSSPRDGSLDEFEEAFEFYLPNYLHRLVLGDLNVNLAVVDSESVQFRDRLSSLNLHILPTDTTFHRIGYDSTLDLIAVGDESSVLTHGKLPVGSSDHDLLYLVYNLYSSRPHPKLITCSKLQKFQSRSFCRRCSVYRLELSLLNP